MNLALSMARVLDAICKFFAIIAAIMALLLVFLTVEQVVARYLFNEPSIGLQELEWHLFGAIFLLANAYTLKVGGHVRVDLFYGRLSAKKKAFIDLMGILLFILPCAYVIITHGIEYAWDARDFNSSRPVDYYSASLFEKEGSLYSLSTSIESFLRKTVLVGEISSDPGGLEARWLIKFLIPMCFILIALQSISLIITNIQTLLGKGDK